jgi:alkylation response protein AidB-like acyl-CoA dehydrogenase
MTAFGIYFLLMEWDSIVAEYLAVCQIRRAMDLLFTDAQDEFRHQVRRWLEANVPSEARGTGPLRSLDTAEGFEAHRLWERTMYDARWSVVSWPAEFGGRGVGLMEWLIFEEEYYRAAAPTRVSQNGIFLLAPTLFEFGTPEQQARFLPSMASGEVIWCQGWSEPDAGSDLAGIRSRAERAGGSAGADASASGGWVLNGQKTWCSRGAFAHWLFGLFRTDPAAQKHRGLTYFLVPMDAPGVTVRPIAQLDGETGFAEVFFEDVSVPENQVLGTVDQGWSVAMATAGSERGLSLRSPARYTEAAGRLLSLYRQRAERDPVAARRVADAVARAVIDAEAYKLHTYWTATRVLDGGSVGPEASMNKVFWSETDLAIYEAALALLGEEAELFGADGHPSSWLDGFLFALAGPIYAGTNEIQRNVVAERVLGLPRV